MQGNALHSFTGQAAAKIQKIIKIVLYTDTEFYTEAAPGSGPDQADKLPGPVNVRHPADTGAQAGNGGGGTTHVKVNSGAGKAVQKRRGPAKLIRVTSQKLEYHPLRTWGGIQVKSFKLPPANQGARAYHLGKVLVTPSKTFYQFTKGTVAQFRHRRQ
jgi:hypothetical protein